MICWIESTPRTGLRRSVWSKESGPGKLGDQGFAALQGHRVDLIEHEYVGHGGEDDQEHEDQSRGPDAAGGSGGNQSQGAEADGDGLNGEAGDGGGAGGALAAEGAVVDFLRSVEGEQVAGRKIHEEAEGDAGEGGGNDLGGRRAVKKTGAQPDQQNFDGDDDGVSQVLAQHNFTKAQRSEKEKLNTDSVAAEGVVDQVGEHQEGVGGAHGKSQIGGASKDAAGIAGAGRTKTKNHQNHHRHDEGEKHGTAAREIVKFFFDDRGDRARPARNIPAYGGRHASGGGFGSSRDRLAQIFTLVLRPEADVEQP